MAKVKFSMSWSVYAWQEMEIPDEYATDKETIIEYLNDHWDEVPIPTDPEYVELSDKIDEDYPITVYKDEDIKEFE